MEESDVLGERDKLITYYREKYDSKKALSNRQQIDYEKRKRISFLLERAI